MEWNEYFLNIAANVALKSKDPNTKIGAVIVGLDNQIISTGFNGFPRGIAEYHTERWERPIKYRYVCHAERNAVDNAARSGVALKGSTLYLVGMGSPTVPCLECAKTVIQAGIVKVVGHAYKPAPDHWIDDFEFSLALLKEACVKFQEIK